MATENNTLDETFIVPFDSINNDDSFRVNSPVDMNDNLHEIYEKCPTFNFCSFKCSDHDAGDFDNNIDPDNNLYNDIDLKCNYYTDNQFDTNMQESVDARSSILAFLGVAKTDSLGSDMLVTRFMKGVSRSRPTVARYQNVWDVSLVLDMFRKQLLLEFLSLYDLSMRTVTLLALVSAQRSQSIHLFNTVGY